MCFKSEMWKHASSLNFVSVEEVRQLSCCSLAFSSCHSKVYHGPMLPAVSLKALGVTGSFWGHRRSRHWISFSHVAPLATSLTLIKLFGRNTRVWFSLTLKSSPCHRAERYSCHRFRVAQLLPKKSICSEGRHTKDFSSILNSVQETLPQMLKKHAAKDGASPATRRAKSERLSGILSLSLFLVRGRVSIETHAFFHLTKKAV